MIAEKSTRVEQLIVSAQSQSDELIDLLVQAKEHADGSELVSLEQEIKERRQQSEALRSLLERQTLATLER
jgi:hypothetical protein